MGTPHRADSRCWSASRWLSPRRPCRHSWARCPRRRGRRGRPVAVTTVRFRSSSSAQLDFARLPTDAGAGNRRHHRRLWRDLELMEAGASWRAGRVGPGAAAPVVKCSESWRAAGTATMDCASAATTNRARSGRYVPIITEAECAHGGDAASVLQAAQTPFMSARRSRRCRSPRWWLPWAHGDPAQRRYARNADQSCVATSCAAPFRTYFTNRWNRNLVGALRTCMAFWRGANLQEMHEVEMVLAPAIKTEGKRWQLRGGFRNGMARCSGASWKTIHPRLNTPPSSRFGRPRSLYVPEIAGANARSSPQPQSSPEPQQPATRDAIAISIRVPVVSSSLVASVSSRCTATPAARRRRGTRFVPQSARLHPLSGPMSVTKRALPQTPALRAGERSPILGICYECSCRPSAWRSSSTRRQA